MRSAGLAGLQYEYRYRTQRAARLTGLADFPVRCRLTTGGPPVSQCVCVGSWGNKKVRRVRLSESSNESLCRRAIASADGEAARGGGVAGAPAADEAPCG